MRPAAPRTTEALLEAAPPVLVSVLTGGTDPELEAAPDAAPEAAAVVLVAAVPVVAWVPLPGAVVGAEPEEEAVVVGWAAPLV